jgi:hypothetical protein
MSKGQLAIVAARARRATGKTVKQAVQSLNVSPGMIGIADMVLDFAPELADLVLGGMPLRRSAEPQAAPRHPRHRGPNGGQRRRGAENQEP